MRSDLTDITLVVDRSGSMARICEDAEGGVNTFIDQQAREPGDALLTLVQFDSEYEFLHEGVPIENVSRYDLVPRGATALLDAVGRAINETGERLAKLAESDRPGLVIFVVVTDGYENASKEFGKPQIKQLIERRQRDSGWQFTFLGANQDAFAEAGSMGFHAAGVADYAADKVSAAYLATSGKVARMRSQSLAHATVSNEFTQEERDQMK